MHLGTEIFMLILATKVSATFYSLASRDYLLVTFTYGQPAKSTSSNL